MKTRERGYMKKHISLKSMFFCAIMVLTMTFNTVNVQAESLDYLGSTVDGSLLTNDNEALGTYKSVARSTYLLEGFVRITNNGNGYVGIFGGTECSVTCNTVKLNIYLERSSGDGNFYSYKKWENVDYNTLIVSKIVVFKPKNSVLPKQNLQIIEIQSITSVILPKQKYSLFAFA